MCLVRLYDASMIPLRDGYRDGIERVPTRYEAGNTDVGFPLRHSRLNWNPSDSGSFLLKPRNLHRHRHTPHCRLQHWRSCRTWTPGVPLSNLQLSCIDEGSLGCAFASLYGSSCGLVRAGNNENTVEGWHGAGTGAALALAPLSTECSTTRSLASSWSAWTFGVQGWRACWVTHLRLLPPFELLRKVRLLLVV